MNPQDFVNARNPFRLNNAQQVSSGGANIIPPSSQDGSLMSGPSAQESSHLFENASRVGLEGVNTFSSAGRNVYHINTVSVQPNATQSASLDSSIVSARPTSSQDPTLGSHLAVGEHHSQIYARLLLPKCLGLPLWLPKPMENLPEVYRKTGVSIGDVGIITKDGQFDFFFNIRLPASDPINRNRVPENFEPINHPVESDAWMPGDYVITRSMAEASSIRPVDNDAAIAVEPPHYQFSASAPAGAIVLVPDGGFRQDLLNTAPYIAYAKKHGKHWYKYINQDRGRGAANGSVYLITGVDKTQVWGTGVYSQLPPEATTHPLTFRKAGLESKYKYAWNRSHFATTRYGPSKQYFDGSTDLPHNQCIFLRGFRVALSEGLWNVLTRRVEVSPIQESSVETLLQKSREVPFSQTDSSFFFGSSSSSIGSTTARAMSSSQESDQDVKIIPNIPTPSIDLHPSDIINRHILSQHTTMDVAVTHDDVWLSVLDKDSEVLPNSNELLARVEQKFEVVCSEGGVSLKPRVCLNTHNSQATESLSALHMDIQRPRTPIDDCVLETESARSEDETNGQDFKAFNFRSASYLHRPNSILSDDQSDIESDSDRRTLWSYLAGDRTSTIDTILEPSNDDDPSDKVPMSIETSRSSSRVPLLMMSGRAVVSLAKRLLQRRTGVSSSSPAPAAPAAPDPSQKQQQPPQQQAQGLELVETYESLFCRALYDYDAQDDPSNLRFRRGDTIEVLSQQPSGWWDGLLRGERGWFPSNYVEIISDEEAEAAFQAAEGGEGMTSENDTGVVDMSHAMMNGRGSQSAGEGYSDTAISQGPAGVESSDFSPQNGATSDFWIPQVTPGGQIYYVNTQTGQRSRDLLQVGEDDVPDSNGAVPASGGQAMPDWELLSNASGSKSVLAKSLGDEYMDEVAREKEWFLLPNYGPPEILIDPDNSICGGTLPALVERLTAHDRADRAFTYAFLVTFKLFTTLDELFDLLVAQFKTKPPTDLTATELKDWTKLKQQIVQMRVINTLKSLITDDAMEEEDLHILARMEAFARSDEARHVSAAKQLLAHIERARDVRKALAQAQLPAPLSVKAKGKLKLADMGPTELARQLTILESNLYMKIKPMEFLQRVREQNTENVDNIATAIQNSNRIADWAADTVLSKKDSRKRGATIKQLISIADRCRSMNNFASMIAITSGLNTPSIRRLKRTWEQVNPRTMAQFAACEMTLDSNKAFTKYRQLMASVTPPCVPFIGVFLSTLQFIQDDNPDMLPGGLVNFQKHQKFSAVLNDIENWQAMPFNFQIVPSIQQYLEESLGKYNDPKAWSERFWALSLKLEPPEGDARLRAILEDLEA